MSKKIDHTKYFDIVMYYFIEEYIRYSSEDCHFIPDYEEHKVQSVEKMYDGHYNVIFEDSPDGFEFKLDIYQKEPCYNANTKKYEVYVQFYACFTPFANKVKYGYCNPLLKFDTTISYRVNECGNIYDLGFWGGSGSPYTIGTILQTVYDDTYIAMYLQYLSDSYFISRKDCRSDRQIKRFVKKMLREQEEHSLKEFALNTESVTFAKKLFDIQTFLFKQNPKQYATINNDFDWSGIENTHVEVVDNGERTSPRYDIYIVGDTYANYVNMLDFQDEGHTFDLLWDNHMNKYARFLAKLNKKHDDLFIDSYAEAEIITEEQFKNRKMFAEKDRTWKPVPEKVFTFNVHEVEE